MAYGIGVSLRAIGSLGYKCLISWVVRREGPLDASGGDACEAQFYRGSLFYVGIVVRTFCLLII